MRATLGGVMLDSPRVSVVMPVYNGMPYLPIALQSILDGTFRDLELIVIDDGSTDGTAEYLQSITDTRMQSKRVPNGGVAMALNEGLAMARGELVARMDADDISAPTRIARQVSFLESHSECVVVGCWAHMINRDGETFDEWVTPTSDQGIRCGLLFEPCIIHPSATYRRSAVLRVGAYRREYEGAEDYDLWTRLCTQGRCRNLPEKLLSFRVHSASATGKQRSHFDVAMRVARNYALVASVPRLEADAMSDLQAFYRHKAVPKTDPARMGRTFAALERHFRTASLDDPSDMSRTLGSLRDRLRWRAYEQAKKTARVPWKAWPWVWLYWGFVGRENVLKTVLPGPLLRAGWGDKRPRAA